MTLLATRLRQADVCNMSPDDTATNLQPRPWVDIKSRPSSGTEAFLGEYQDVHISHDSVETLPFADPSLMDIVSLPVILILPLQRS